MPFKHFCSLIKGGTPETARLVRLALLLGGQCYDQPAFSVS